jgi:hypothetical protein
MKTFDWRHGATCELGRTQQLGPDSFYVDVIVWGPHRPTYQVRLLRSAEGKFSVRNVFRRGRTTLSYPPPAEHTLVGYDVAHAAQEFVERGAKVAAAVASIGAVVLTLDPTTARQRAVYERCAQQTREARAALAKEDHATGFSLVDWDEYTAHKDQARELYLAGYTAARHARADQLADAFSDAENALFYRYDGATGADAKKAIVETVRVLVRAVVAAQGEDKETQQKVTTEFSERILQLLDDIIEAEKSALFEND